jgi:hypothetical protein
MHLLSQEDVEMSTITAMRRFTHNKALPGCRLLAMAVFLLGPGLGQAADWRELPPFDLDECARVTQSVEANPASPVPGNYMLMTTFAADDGPVGAGSIRPPGLVTSLIDTFAADPRTGVTRSRSLVTHAGSDDRSSNLHWIVADENGDGLVDRVQLFELARDEFGRLSLTGAEAPLDRLDAIQAYFDDASERLLARAGQETPAQCR